MRCGYFDDEHREYVITTPKTPVKWINYLGTLKFGGFVDHTGGLLLCKGDPALNRITKYLPQSPASHFKGQTLYLRWREDGPAGREDASGGERYHVFSPFFTPTLKPLESFECRVGMGYTRIISRYRGLKVETVMFVPEGEAVYLMDVTVTCESGARKDVAAIPVVEYTHFDALKQFTNADWVPQTMQSRIKTTPDGWRLLTQYAFMKRGTAENFLTASMPFSSFESDRKVFLGDNEYGDFSAPLALQQDELSNYEAHRGDNVGALMLKLGNLSEGQSIRFTVFMGQEPDAAAAYARIKPYFKPGAVDAKLAAMSAFWGEYLGQMQVRTPDAAFDSMVNVHNPRQCFMTKNWSRDLSLYQLGFGGRGIGFRDSSQDTMAVMGHMPVDAKDLLRKLLAVQLPEGKAMHQFYASTMEANMGDAREGEDRPQYYGDDHLWIVLAVASYLKETGDYAFLEEAIPFYDATKGAHGAKDGGAGKAPVLEHLKRSVAFTRGDVGKHGLPHLGFADWNDTVNLRKGAESLFNANLYGKALLELIELLEFRGDAPGAGTYRAWYGEMKDRVNLHAWDGSWWVRWFDSDGSPIGSDKNEKGKIWANGQSWPVLSGFAPEDRAQAALDSVNRLLNTSAGIKLSAPGYDGFDPKKGGVTTYPPGAKENSGIFLHANPWVIIAECMMGNGERAWRYYNQINPAARNESIETFECEPYVYPQNILGDEHPQFGLARNSWLSGTASWSYQAATQYIAGIRPAHGGLVIDPCIPKAWSGFSVTRRWRGATYAITVKNPGGVNKGVKSISVDGKLLPAGAPVPSFGDGKMHTVEAVMG
jgi:cellobiose phosphorylase